MRGSAGARPYISLATRGISMDSNQTKNTTIQSVVVSTNQDCTTRSEVSNDASFLSDIDNTSHIGEDSNLSGASLNPDQCRDFDNAADQLDKMDFKPQTGNIKKSKLTLEERKEACKVRLEAKGIKWNPELFGKRISASGETSCTPKRNRPDNNTPPSADAERKRQKRAEGSKEAFSLGTRGSFRAAVVTKKVAIVPVSFPELRLTQEQGSELEATIADRLINYRPPTVGAYPIFEGTYMETGALIVSCTNDQSKDWVVDLASSLELQGGVKLKAGDKKDILRATKVLVRIPPKLNGKDANTICGMLDKQNPNLYIKDWKLISFKDDNNGSVLVFLVNDQALNAIKVAGHRAHIVLWNATILVLSGREKNKNKDGVQGTADQPAPQ